LVPFIHAGTHRAMRSNRIIRQTVSMDSGPPLQVRSPPEMP